MRTILVVLLLVFLVVGGAMFVLLARAPVERPTGQPAHTLGSVDLFFDAQLDPEARSLSLRNVAAASPDSLRKLEVTLFVETDPSGPPHFDRDADLRHVSQAYETPGSEVLSLDALDFTWGEGEQAAVTFHVWRDLGQGELDEQVLTLPVDEIIAR